MKTLAQTLTTLAIMGFTPVWAICPGDTTHSGDYTDEQFGTAVAGIGDIDADGADDILIGSPFRDFNGADRGTVKIISGLTGVTIRTYVGKQADERFGFAVAGLEDINGDGVRDYAIGAPGFDSSGVDRGTVYVHSGANGVYFMILRGAAAGDLFGSAISSAGLFNNDATPDFAVGATFAADGLLAEAGSVTVFSGIDATELYSQFGPEDSAHLGASMADGGHIDGDLLSDLLVGAPGAKVGSNRVGKAYAVSGATNSVIFTLSGENKGDLFGAAVAGLGEVTGDSRDDILVGAPSNDDGAVDAGKLYIFSGASGAQVATAVAPSAHGLLGSAIAALADIDGDNVPDYAAGSAGHSVFGPLSYDGAMYVFNGATNLVMITRLATGNDERFGSSLTAGDWDKDGRNDLAIGAPLSSADKSHEGSVTLMRFSDGDEDGVICQADNCPFKYNPLQENFDNDAFGDSCFMPSYLTPLTIVARDFDFPSSGQIGAPLPDDEADVNLRIIDPDGLVIGVDSADNTTNTIGDSATYYNSGGSDSIVINDPKSGEYLIEVVSEIIVNPQDAYTVGIRIDGSLDNTSEPQIVPTTGTRDTVFIYNIPYAWGDANGDREIDIGDAAFLIAFIFSEGPAPIPVDAGDADCSGDLNVADVIHMIAYYFMNVFTIGCGG